MRNLLMSFCCMIAIGFLALGCETQTVQPELPAASGATHIKADGDPHEGEAQTNDGDAEIAEAMAALSPDDRKAAEAQRFCAVSTGSPLGSMGTPVKLEIKGEPVFLCCAGCKSAALKNPDEILAAMAKRKTEDSDKAK